MSRSTFYRGVSTPRSAGQRFLPIRTENDAASVAAGRPALTNAELPAPEIRRRVCLAIGYRRIIQGEAVRRAIPGPTAAIVAAGGAHLEKVVVPPPESPVRDAAKVAARVGLGIEDGHRRAVLDAGRESAIVRIVLKDQTV